MTYDAVIVGASVGGLSVGAKLARNGWRVCIIDRRREIGVPVRCGEATGNRAELARFVKVDESWIARDVKGLAVHVNDSFQGRRQIADTGVVLHRDLFELALAREARAHGADIVLRSAVTGLLTRGDSFGGVTVEDGDPIEAAFVVGADGCESKIGQWAGITGPLRLAEAASAMQYRVRSDFCNDGFLHFFVGSSVITPGYVWVFPKSDSHVSVGAAVYGPSAGGPKARAALDAFIARRLGDAPRDRKITGCAPLTLCPRNLTKANVLVVGDAARQVNPLTAGGIMNTLEAADSAADALLACRNRKDVIVAMQGYSRTWARAQRRQQKIFCILRDLFIRADDRELIAILKAADSIFRRDVDRSRPFTFPVIPLLRLLAGLLPKVIGHWRILWQ